MNEFLIRFGDSFWLTFSPWCVGTFSVIDVGAFLRLLWLTCDFLFDLALEAGGHKRSADVPLTLVVGDFSILVTRHVRNLKILLHVDQFTLFPSHWLAINILLHLPPIDGFPKLDTVHPCDIFTIRQFLEVGDVLPALITLPHVVVTFYHLVRCKVFRLHDKIALGVRENVALHVSHPSANFFLLVVAVFFHDGVAA